MAINQFSLLKTRRFLPLFITQFLGAFNDNIYKNAIVILITYQIAEAAGLNAQMMVTAAAGIFILPFFLFSATAGQLADKLEKSTLIRTLKFIEILIMLCATTALYLHNVTLLMSVLFLLGIQASFFGPVKYAILPAQLKEDELIAGNGLIEAGTFISILLGTILGGILILRTVGVPLISTILILVSVIGFISSLYIPKTTPTNTKIRINYNFISETKRVLQYSRAQWDISLAILGISWFWLIGAVFLSEFPVFAKDILHANEHVVTWFIAIFSVGIAVGSLLCNRILKGKVHATYVPVGIIGISIFAIDMYFASNHYSAFSANGLMSVGAFLHTFTGWHISIDLLLITICGGLYTVPLYAILQERSKPEHRARIIASNNVMNSFFMVIAAIGTAIMLKLNFKVNDVFLTVAILNSLVAIYICKLLPDLLLKAVLRIILKAVYRVSVNGLENYYAAGDRVVIIANHTSFLDAALFAAFLPDKCTFAVDTMTAKKWWVKYFLRLVDAYPVDPTNPMAIKSLIEVVRANKKCVIFPEGRITVTGALMKIHEGPGMIADKADAVLLPICIQGAQSTPFSRMKGKIPIRFAPKITISIFPPQTLEIPAEIKGRQRRQQIGLQLYDILTNIVFESCDQEKTLFNSLIEAKNIHGKNYKIVSDVEMKPVSYQQLIFRSFALAQMIKNNTNAGDYIGVMLPNVISTPVTFFALQAYHRVPAMLNFSAGSKNVLLACQTAKIKLVYTSKKFVTQAKLLDIVENLVNQNISVIYLEDLRTAINWKAKLTAKIMALFPSLAYRTIHRNTGVQIADSPAVVLFTSGSEGTPKGVILSHKNLQANRFQLSACVDFTELDKIFNALPVFHAFGLSGGLLLPILSGIEVFLYPSPLHYRIVPQLVYGLNSTILFGTDTFLSGYAKHANPYDFYSIRYVFSGAEKLRMETLTTWTQKFGVRIFDGYGATETSPVLTTNTPMQCKTGTVGRLLPGIKYQLKAVPGIETGGLLSVSGPNIMKGYLLSDNPGVIVPLINNSYDTGDIVSIDSEGFLSIQGRVKRFAKIAGEMVSLPMVEESINVLWPGYQHAVVNMPDSKKGEQLWLMTTFANATREELVKYARAQKLNELSIPKNISIVKNIPLLGSGKIDYISVKKELETVGAHQPLSA